MAHPEVQRVLAEAGAIGVRLSGAAATVELPDGAALPAPLRRALTTEAVGRVGAVSPRISTRWRLSTGRFRAHGSAPPCYPAEISRPSLGR